MRKMLGQWIKGAKQYEKNSSLSHLTSLVRRYAVEQQRVPNDLVDLVNLKYLAAIPAAPPGQRFVIDRKRVEVRLE